MAAALFSLTMVTLTGVGVAATHATSVGSQATVKIVNEDEGGVGSGVDVGDGIIITANHVVGDSLSVTIYRENGDIEPAIVLWTDPVRDVAAVMLISGKSGSHTSLSCSYLPHAGDAVEVVGNPLGVLDYIHTYGRVARNGFLRTELLSWPTAMVMNVTATNGNSGGPVLDSEGYVIGILVGGLLGHQGQIDLAFAVPSYIVCEDLLAPTS